MHKKIKFSDALFQSLREDYDLNLFSRKVIEMPLKLSKNSDYKH